MRVTFKDDLYDLGIILSKGVLKKRFLDLALQDKKHLSYPYVCNEKIFDDLQLMLYTIFSIKH